MKMQFVDVRIEVAQGSSKVAKWVPAWELPLIYGAGFTVEEVRRVCVERPTISIGGEYERLSNVYDGDRKLGGTTIVDQVYGTAQLGRARLKEALLEARLPPSTEVTPFDASPELRQDLLEALAGDSDDLIGDETPATTEVEGLEA